jgi:hypothetical protein
MTVHVASALLDAAAEARKMRAARNKETNWRLPWISTP